MHYQLELARSFTAKQGLKSPVLAAQGKAPTAPAEGFAVVMRVGVLFDESELKPTGWFVDTDALDQYLDYCAAHLISDTWTSLFDFRPTFELVARWIFQKLAPDVPGLTYVELENVTLGVSTRYTS